MPDHEAQDLTLLLFRPLWQTPFTPENCHIAEIILELPFWRSMLTLLSGVAHNPASRVSESGIFYC